MKSDTINKDLKTADYNVIKRIEEHAKNYEQVSDKKEFLKNVSAYEQKCILLNSKRPYDVLMYLDELDLQSSRLVISELTYEEISKILELFTSEDKKNFYKSFSDLSLVNEFIKYDNNSSEHIKTLSFDRKVDILESTNKDTVQSSSKLYESMSSEEKTKAVELVTDVHASSVLIDIADNNDKNLDKDNNLFKEIKILENKTNEKENVQEEQEQNNKDKKQENPEQINEDKNCFIRDNIQKFKYKISELQTIDINEENIYALLSTESKKLIDQEFELYVENKKNNSISKETSDTLIIDNSNNVSNDSIVNKFNEMKTKCERDKIQLYQNYIVQENQNITNKSK